METHGITREPRRSRSRLARTVRAAGTRGLLLAGGFWALAEGDRSALAAGIVAVVAASAASLLVAPPAATTVRPVRLLQLAWFFLVGSLRGGVDVAIRALSPWARIAPTRIEIETQLPPGPAQTAFTAALSLMPGTLCVGAEGRRVLIHVLVDRGPPLRRELAQLEARIAAAIPPDDRGAADHG